MKDFTTRLLWVAIGIVIAIALNYFFTSQTSLGIELGIIGGMLLESFLNKKEKKDK